MSGQLQQLSQQSPLPYAPNPSGGSRDLRGQIAALGSNLVLNLSLFLIMMLASMKLAPEEFTKLSLATSSMTMLATGLDFGLNQSCLKLAIEHQRFSFIALNFVAKAISFAIVSLALLIATMLAPAREFVVLAAAAGTAFWAATRVVEQYGRRFERLAALNLALAGTRVTFGAVAIASHSWILIVLAVHVFAQLPIHVASLLGTVRRLFGSVEWRDLRDLSRISPLMFGSATLFSSLPLITQTLIYRTSDVLASSAFGVVLIFMAPLSLVIVTLRVYILPQTLTVSLRHVDVFGWGRGSMHLLAGGLAGVLTLGLVPASVAINWFYGARFPDADRFFLVYFGAYSLASVIGLYNIRSQRGGLVRLDFYANLVRAGATALLALLPPLNPLAIVAWSAMILVLGELGLCLLLGLKPERMRLGNSAPDS